VTIAVTGASGGLGGRVARLLAALGARGEPLRLVGRDPSRMPDLGGSEVALASGYDDREAMAAAFAGCDTVFLVSGREAPDRVEQHMSAVNAAVDAGVARVVYTSFLGAAPDCTFTLGRHHWATEQFIEATGLAWTFLRDSLYLDVVPSLASADGVIAGPAGDGRCGFVARDDVAEVAVRVLTEPGRHDGQAYDLTGPEALTLAEAAAALGKVAGRDVRYVPETEAEAYASRARYGAPDYEVEGWVSSYQAIAQGELDLVTEAVPVLTGRPAQSMASFLDAHPEAWAHLAG
jgi:NAD(P)H dehydrogenase (quinone)